MTGRMREAAEVRGEDGRWRPIGGEVVYDARRPPGPRPTERHVWDPRREAWIESDNPALWAGEMLRRIYGFERVDWSSIADHAEYADKDLTEPIDGYDPVLVSGEP